MPPASSAVSKLASPTTILLLAIVALNSVVLLMFARHDTPASQTSIIAQQRGVDDIASKPAPPCPPAQAPPPFQLQQRAPERPKTENDAVEVRVDERHLPAEKLSFFLETNHGYPILVHSEFADHNPEADDVTWVTQLTSDRLDSFLALLERWHGPVCAVVYTDQLQQDIDTFRQVQQVYNRVDFHYTPASQLHYPVNLLRNVAMDHARTDFLLFADVDFLPNSDAYEHIKKNVPRWKNEDLKVIRVLPAFEIDHDCKHNTTVPPLTKAELISMGQCIHQVHNDPGRVIAHKHTNYERWISTTDDDEYDIEFSAPYEPYYVAHKSVPRYDSRFIVYGNDKTVQASEASLRGWKFKAIPTSFVVHMDHGAGPWVLFKCPREVLETLMKAFWGKMDRIYKEKVPPPPQIPRHIADRFEMVTGDRGKDCNAVCQKINADCRAEYFEHINSCDFLEEKFHCFAGCGNNFGPDLPNFDCPNQRCLVQRDFHDAKCEGRHIDTKRLCPCVKRLP